VRQSLSLSRGAFQLDYLDYLDYRAICAEKQQSITLVNQSFDERKIIVLRSDASDKSAKQNESDDHFRLAPQIGS
jgi:hypothetical protein